METLTLSESLETMPSTETVESVERRPPMLGAEEPISEPRELGSEFWETPGMRRRRDMTSRPRVRRVLICLESRRAEFSAEAVWTTARPAVTLMTSVVLPGWRVKVPAGRYSLEVTVMALRSMDWKPWKETRRE